MKKRKLIFFIAILILITSAISVSLALYNLIKVSNNQMLIAGDMYISFVESNELSPSKATMRDSYDPNSYFEFIIKGKNTNKEKNIVYDISLEYGNNIQGKNRIQDHFLKFRLVTVDNNNVETEIFDDKNYLSIDDKRIYVSTINKNTTSEVNIKYRLYMWIDNKDLVIGNTDYADYTTSEWNNLFASVKVKVTGDFSTKEVVTEPYIVMQNISTNTNWTDIRANIVSVEFKTDGVIPNNAITSFDVTDETSSDDVYLYTLDSGLNDGTYKAVIVADDVIYAPSDSTDLFRNMDKLVSFNSRDFKVDHVTSMYAFFTSDYELQDIGSLSTWNTSNVETMRGMFLKNYKLKDISSLANWDVSAVKDMTSLFRNCSNLSDVNAIANWNVEKVELMTTMFTSCFELEMVNLSNWSTKSLTNMYGMFAMWDSEGHTTLISKLKNIILSNKFDTKSVTNMSTLLDGNTHIQDYSFLQYFDTTNVRSMYAMFYHNNGLTNLNYLANWNVEKVEDMSYMFKGCFELETADLSNWSTPALTNTANMFAMKNIDGSGTSGTNLNNIILSNKFDTKGVETMSYMFAFNNNIQDYSFLQYINTNSATNLSYMFRNNYGLTNLNYLTNWNVSSVTNFNYMFAGCQNLTNTSSVNDWNISSTATFARMFNSAPSHPTFSKVAGTWNSVGTFTPSS